MKKIISMVAVLTLTAMMSVAQKPGNGFYGMWNLRIEGGSVGWLHVFENSDGMLDAELLWRWGSVLPVQNAFITGENTMMVVRASESIRKGANDDERKGVFTHLFEITRDRNRISGVSIEPSRNGMETTKMNFYGWKLPDVPAAPDLSQVKYGKPIRLFNGKDLTGWRLINPNQANGFKVLDGVMVNDPVQKEGQKLSYGNIRTEQEFEDFNLKLEVNIPKGSNSGVYLRGNYEIQVLDSYGKKPDSHNMGALYSRITPSVAAERPAGEWQTMDITFVDRHLTVVLNGTTIIDNEPVYGPTGGAISADVFSPGPIYLQGDHGKVSYRNIVLTPVVK
jgi:hypothetical protein